MIMDWLYYGFLVAIFGFSLITFISLYLITAPYGRHQRKGWGPSIHPKLAWILMELPAALVIALFFFTSDRITNVVAIVFICMWEMHYIQRTFIYPFLMRGSKNKFPIMLMAFSVIFNTMNGYVNGYYLFHLADPYPLSWLYDPRFILGALLFITGYYINRKSDNILRNLRKPGETGYKIPRGGMYKYVSSPNYFGEIVEWIGWAIATWSIAGVAFAVFTIANLMPRAAAHHQWYKEKFPDYPEERQALIPFIY